MVSNHEYRLDMKVRNNLFIERIEHAGYKTVGEFCRKNNLQPTDMAEVINMKRPAIMSNGKFRPIVLKAADILECSPDNLFSENQLNLALKNNKHTLKVNEAEMKFMIESSNKTKLLEELIDDDKRDACIDKVLNTLNYKEREVLKLRFGLEDGLEHTFKDISQRLNYTPERIRQIQSVALRKLRKPSKSEILKQFI